MGQSENTVPAPLACSTCGIALRLFLTCWIIYAAHFTTNIVREIYLTLAIGDHLSFRVDEYAHMHPDLFEKEGYGWHIGNNPGVSMLAAIPYAAVRPLTDRIVNHVQQARAANPSLQPPEYDSPWPQQREFYKEAWKRGFDIKFGLAAVATQWLCMAPGSALAVVLMFYVLRTLTRSDRSALWLSLLYAFATPVFFRTGFLNHNLMLGHIAFLGYVALWNPWETTRWSARARHLLAGVTGGTAILFDYSGVILLGGLFLYALARHYRAAGTDGLVQHGLWYVLGTIPPVLLLWFYQWQSFGNPFLPGQHWMPPVEWIDEGYQGFTLPQFELFRMLGFDYRFGLFVVCPMFLLALLLPFLQRRKPGILPVFETRAVLLLLAALWLFFSCVSYTRLEFNTGIRYMAPIFPFLFLPVAAVLVRLPLRLVYFIGLFSLALSWPLAMHREVETGPGVLEPVISIFTGGFKLPVLTVLSRMGDTYGSYFSGQVSALPILLLLAAIVAGIWYPFRRSVP